MEVTDPIRSLLRFKGNEFYCIGPEAPVYEALELMAGKHVGALPVMRDRELLGIVSERDYARKVILKGRASRTTLVEEIMTTRVECASPDDTVDECMRIMTRHRIRHLPVREGNRIIGIVSIGDLVNWIIMAQDATIDHLNNYIAGTYPA